MSGVTTSSLSLAWTLRNWVILDYEEANGLTVRPWAPFLSFQSLERRLFPFLFPAVKKRGINGLSQPWRRLEQRLRWKIQSFGTAVITIVLSFHRVESSERLGHKRLRTLMKRSSLWYLPGVHFHLVEHFICALGHLALCCVFEPWLVHLWLMSFHLQESDHQTLSSRLTFVSLGFCWLMLRLTRSLSRLETQDIKTQPQFNHYKGKISASQILEEKCMSWLGKRDKVYNLEFFFPFFLCLR